MGERGRLRTDEVAGVLDVSTSTVIAYTKDGLLRTTRTAGGHRRYDGESAQELARVLAMPEGADRDSALEALRRRNQAVGGTRPDSRPDPVAVMADLFASLKQADPLIDLGAFLDGIEAAGTGPQWADLIGRARADLMARFGETSSA